MPDELHSSPVGERCNDRSPAPHWGLEVGAYSGVLRTEEEIAYFGHARALEALPAQKVRRLSELERGVIACLIDLPTSEADVPYVLASRYGAMAHTLKILKDISGGQPLSPTAFALSVHNAVLGAASQITGNRGGHTAIAAGEMSVSAGYMECCARLAAGDPEVVLILSDFRLPGEYADFENAQADVQLACTLRLSEARPGLVASSLPAPGPDCARQFLDLLAMDTKDLKWCI